MEKEMCSLEKRGSIFVLTLTGDDEHRINPTLVDSVRAAIRRVRSEADGPSALVTTAHGKFFSNGYDLAWAGSDVIRRQLMDSKLQSLVADLISLPMPTIAAVSGHASAAGFVLALAHDYIVMRKDRGFLYMSEVDIGLKIPAWFVAVLKTKAGSPAVWRDVVLTARKVTAEVGVEMGIVHSAHDSAEETVKAAVEMGETMVRRKWDGHVYAHSRATLFADVVDLLSLHGKPSRL